MVVQIDDALGRSNQDEEITEAIGELILRKGWKDFDGVETLWREEIHWLVTGGLWNDCLRGKMLSSLLRFLVMVVVVQSGQGGRCRGGARAAAN